MVKPKTKTAAAKVEQDQSPERAALLARIMVRPNLRHGATIESVAEKMTGGKNAGDPTYRDFGYAIKGIADEVTPDNLSLINDLLVAQALSLDSIFTEMARRSVVNVGEYIDASERYMRLALKAQANSRATLEALARLHQPREQTVRHVHVNEGGQAVIADQFHHHAGGNGNAQSAGQPYAPNDAAAGSSPSLPGPNPIGQSLPVASREGEPAMPNARRPRKRRTERQ